MLRRVAAAIAFVVFGLFITIGSSVVAQTNRTAPAASSQQFSEIDRQFMLSAGEAGIANIMLGQLALQRATSNQVKQFAQAEIDEQTNVKNELTKIAPRAGVTLPKAPGAKFQASMKQISALKGEQFDQAYMSEGGVNAHLENAATFQREAAFGRNSDLIRLVNNGLPIINRHFTTASKLTNYQFAQVPRRFNTTSNLSGTVPPTTPTTPRMTTP